MNLDPITITHTDVDWHEAFVRYAPRVFPRIGFRKWYERGGWDEGYRAIAITDGEEIRDSPLFVRGDHDLPTVPFKFPMLAQT